MDLTDYLNGTKRCWSIKVQPNSEIITGPATFVDEAGTGIMIQLVRDIPEGMAPEDVSKGLVNVRVIEPDEDTEAFPEVPTDLSGRPCKTSKRVCTTIGISNEAAYALMACLEQTLKDAKQN